MKVLVKIKKVNLGILQIRNKKSYKLWKLKTKNNKPQKNSKQIKKLTVKSKKRLHKHEKSLLNHY